MASKKTLNAKNLEALGADRLAELLIEISTGDATAKRRLRLELAGAAGPVEVAREIRKRLITIARARSFIDWQKRKAFINDLETQRRAIIDQVAKTDPAEALDLLWRFMALANPVFERCDDSGGTVIGVFQAACRDLGRIATAATTNPKLVAEQAFRALTENEYGQYDDLIEALTPPPRPDRPRPPQAALHRAVEGFAAKAAWGGAGSHRLGLGWASLCRRLRRASARQHGPYGAAGDRRRAGRR
jgi:hypothetical protein